MKNLIIALLLFPLAIQAQSKWVSHRNQVGIWDKYSKRYDWGEINDANIPITFEKYRIVLDNEANSIYKIIENLGEEIKRNNQGIKVTSNSWSAIDESGKRCRVTMIQVDDPDYDPLVFQVLYDDVLIRYYCKMKGIDKLLN